MRISAIIYVERAGPEGDPDRRQGFRLKKIGTEARLDLERMLGRRCFWKPWSACGLIGATIRSSWRQPTGARLPNVA